MALYLITGVSGTGKSTACAELRERGYTAYDGDTDHLAHWFNNETGAIEYYDGTVAFIETHQRSVARETVKRLAQEARDKPVFLCNDPANEDELLDLFAQVFALVVDDDTRNYRLANRKSGHYDWGKLPHEMAYTRTEKALAYERYKRPQYSTIDATQPTAAIVDQILAHL